MLFSGAQYIKEIKNYILKIENIPFKNTRCLMSKSSNIKTFQVLIYSITISIQTEGRLK